MISLPNLHATIRPFSLLTPPTVFPIIPASLLCLLPCTGLSLGSPVRPLSSASLRSAGHKSRSANADLTSQAHCHQYLPLVRFSPARETDSETVRRCSPRHQLTTLVVLTYSKGVQQIISQGGLPSTRQKTSRPIRLCAGKRTNTAACMGQAGGSQSYPICSYMPRSTRQYL
ncbi:hypothetical protein BD289DRAFT_242083 [Coniella lustricola]|uniref:Uncharacterized protein n=1 Tax=Coniella lustricola TaxID=2025994 RepID=A0A2T3A9N5_9PEZI|nr:hypothetical protein BD289DRAFT_242083 [Coniella lustricola]